LARGSLWYGLREAYQLERATKIAVVQAVHKFGFDKHLATKPIRILRARSSAVGQATA